MQFVLAKISSTSLLLIQIKIKIYIIHTVKYPKKYRWRKCLRSELFFVCNDLSSNSNLTHPLHQ